MNYFELFGIPERIKVDKTHLRDRFFSLSKKNHPDFFVNEDAESQVRSLEITAELNKAFHVLGDEDETIRYVLREKNMLEEEERAALPQDFLMEMLELNEEIEDSKDADDNERAYQKLVAFQKDIYEPVAKIIEDGAGPFQEEELLRLKEYYLKRKYLKRLASQLGRKL